MNTRSGSIHSASACADRWVTDWMTWSPRAEIAPRFAVEDAGGRSGGPALVIDGGGRDAAYGEWQRRFDGLAGGRVYRFTAWYRTRGVDDARHHAPARIEWFDASGRALRQPDYALDVAQQDDWTRIEYLTPAPPEATSALVRLGLRWSRGAVWWDGVEIREEASPRARPARLGTVFHRPRDTKSAAGSVQQFADLLRRDVRPGELDAVCLPEGVSVIGTGLTYADVAEPLNGPTAQTLGRVAHELNCYLVAGLIEREGSIIYNTAVLLDRRGEIVGSYRKTHLPQAEIDGGITPGREYPVFETDFGKVGLMVCWDVQFPEPARALALRGAEILMLPIWGGNDLLARARAIENHVVLVSSSFDMKTFIVGPVGEVLAEATPERPVAKATVDLNQTIIQPWLGDMKTCTWAERRPGLR